MDYEISDSLNLKGFRFPHDKIMLVALATCQAVRGLGNNVYKLQRGPMP